MSKGIGKRVTIGDIGYVSLAGGNHSFIYDVSATKHPDFNPGDFVDLPDGRRFRYCKSTGVCFAGQGNKFATAMTDGVDFTLLGASQAIGNSQITFAAATHNAFTKDELRGGLVLISDQDAAVPIDSKVQNRMCIGNDAADANAPVTIYLDGPLVRAVTAATYAFVMPNPYNKIIAGYYSAGSGTSVAGVAAAFVSASGMYFWLQTRGFLWLAIAGNLGKTALKRGFGFRNDGAIVEYDNSVSNATTQYGGYVIDNNDTANGATFCMLALE
jgi:hypothetical protein